jgi:3-methyladenine DNA glycosylase AlkD
MDQPVDLDAVKALAAALDAELRRLPVPNTPNERAVRVRYSRRLKTESAGFVLGVARTLFHAHGQRWTAYELVRAHPAAFARIGPAELEEFGRGMDSWWSVDAFARTLAGPAWVHGQVPDELILQWAGSPDPWWRRAALVSTVAWNVRSQGGPGDVERTLRVCNALAADHEDMVVKALSWALRELVVHDPQAVRGFLEQRRPVLAGGVIREVGSKLTTGLKNPRPQDR